MKRPCLCYDCFSVLYLFHKFKRRCLKSEGDLRLYLREKPHTDIVDLQEALGYPDKTTETQPTKTGEKHHQSQCFHHHYYYFKLAAGGEDDPLGDHLDWFRCSLCGRSSCTESELREHLHVDHNKNKETVCIVCYAEMPDKESLNEHMAAHTGQRHSSMVEAVKCGEDEREGEKCCLCHSSFKEENQLREHLVTVHNKDKHVCVVCLKEAKSRKGLLDHMRIHKRDKLFVCSFCSRSYVQKNRLYAHVRIVHKGIKNARECPVCGRWFLEPKTFHKHVELHAKPDSEKYTCERCKWVFSTHSALVYHSERHKSKN